MEKKASKKLVNELNREFAFWGSAQLFKLMHDQCFYFLNLVGTYSILPKGSYVILLRVPLPHGQHKTVPKGDRLIFFTVKGLMYTRLASYGDPLKGFERV